MLRILATIFAGLLGLAFGSFLNVCLSRWPDGESVVHPRSHCRACGRTLAWWENLPVMSWIALRGRCRSCGTWISVRYPLVEAAVGCLWATLIWNSADLFLTNEDVGPLWALILALLSSMAFLWLMVALAVLDFENLWLPDRLTLPGAVAGFLVFGLSTLAQAAGNSGAASSETMRGLGIRFVSIFAAAGIILLIRWLYWLIRRREGLGLGDAKLMALLAAWLGLPLAVLSLFLGVVLGAGVAIVFLLTRSRQPGSTWSAAKLPIGSFLCIGGIVTALWGEQILSAYLHWAGL